GGDEETGCMRIVLSLGEDIGGNIRRYRSLICDHCDLTGTCGEINLGILTEHHLCGGYVHVARSHDLIHRIDGLCPECHRGYRLRTPALVDLVHAGNIESDKSERLDRRRGTATDFRNAGDSRGNRAHKGGRGICSTATGHVCSDTGERGCLHAEGNAGLKLVEPEAPGQLELVKPADPYLRFHEAFGDSCIDLLVRRIPCIIIDRDCIQMYLIEFSGKLDKSRIPLRSYLFDDLPDRAVHCIQTGCTPRDPGFDINRAPHSRKTRRERLLRFSLSGPDSTCKYVHRRKPYSNPYGFRRPGLWIPASFLSQQEGTRLSGRR